MTTGRNHDRIQRRLISQLRKLNIFPRIFLLFCIFLILSTGFITILNQISHTREMEKSKIQELSTLAQRDGLVLEQERLQLENSMDEFAGDPRVLEALENCRLLAVKANLGDKDAQGMIDKNQDFLRRSLTSISKSTKGICGMVFVNSDILYKLDVAPTIIGTLKVPDPKSLLESENRSCGCRRLSLLAGCYPGDFLPVFPSRRYRFRYSRLHHPFLPGLHPENPSAPGCADLLHLSPAFLSAHPRIFLPGRQQHLYSGRQRHGGGY